MIKHSTASDVIRFMFVDTKTFIKLLLAVHVISIACIVAIDSELKSLSLGELFGGLSISFILSIAVLYRTASRRLKYLLEHYGTSCWEMLEQGRLLD